jgi:hypothetical protein
VGANHRLPGENHRLPRPNNEVGSAV